MGTFCRIDVRLYIFDKYLSQDAGGLVSPQPGWKNEEGRRYMQIAAGKSKTLMPSNFVRQSYPSSPEFLSGLY